MPGRPEGSSKPDPRSAATEGGAAATARATAAGAKPVVPSGAKSGGAAGVKPAVSAGAKPAAPAGAKSAVSAGSKSSASTGAKPAATAGAKPAVSSGVKPAAPAGAKHAATAGAKPAVSAGVKPAAPAGAKPAATPGAKPAATAGAKPAATASSKLASPAPAPARPPGPRKWPKGGPSKAELKKYRQALDDLRNGTLRSSKGLEKEALKSSGQDFSVDHMADHGTDNFEQDFTLGLLEGKTEVLRDVEDALQKLDGKGDLPFGLCETCADLDESRWPRGCETCPWVPKGRLDVVPYARLCIKRQEQQEDRA